MPLKPVDIRVLESFLEKKEREGKFLNTDGEILYRRGLVGSNPFAIWELEHISVIDVLSVRSDDMIMRALRKRLPESQIRASWTKPPDLGFITEGDFPRYHTGPLLQGGILTAWIPYPNKPHVWAGSFDWGQLNQDVYLRNFRYNQELNVDLLKQRMQNFFSRSRLLRVHAKF